MPFIGIRLGNPSGLGGGIAAAPTILLSSFTMPENSAQATAVGTLSVVNGTGTYTFTLTDDAGGRFQVAGTNGVNLQAGATNSDYETATSYDITVHADNGAGSVLDRTFTILITDVAEGGVDDDDWAAWVAAA
jgi:large repetitive protein